MDREKTRAAVRAIVETVLNAPVPLDANATRRDLLGWDSLKHVEVVFAVEAEFGVTFTEEDMAALDSIEAIVDAVERLRAA